VGAAVGVAVVLVTALTKSWTPIIHPLVIPGAPLLGLATGAVAGLYPAAKQRTSNPARHCADDDTLRHSRRQQPASAVLDRRTSRGRLTDQRIGPGRSAAQPKISEYHHVSPDNPNFR